MSAQGLTERQQAQLPLLSAPCPGEGSVRHAVEAQGVLPGSRSQKLISEATGSRPLGGVCRRFGSEAHPA